VNKTLARKLADKVTRDQLIRMFDRAEKEIKDWAKRSSVNSSFTKGKSWNILRPALDEYENLHVLAIKNMIWEFGDYLDDDILPKKSNRKKPTPIHQEPILK